MTSGLQANDECMEHFAYFSFLGLLMLYEIDECMQRVGFIRFGCSRVNKVSPSHDLSCVFVHFCSIHLYFEHTIRFVNLDFSGSPIFVFTLTASQ